MMVSITTKIRKQKSIVEFQKLKLHSQCLFRIYSKSYMNNWTLKDDIENLTLSLDSYSAY